MTQEEKELLLKDLCARLPYGVNVSLQTGKRKLTGVLDAVYPTDDRVIVDNLSQAIAPINVRTGGFLIERDNVKPYLRPMSSMIEGKYKEAKANGCIIYHDTSPKNKGLMVIASPKGIDWLNAHHFDYRTDEEGKTMIEKGLALEAPEGIYD